MTPKQPLDWLAVQMVCEGTPMALRFPAERLAAVRFYERRLLKVGDNQINQIPGALTAEDLARLICGNVRSVQRIRSTMPAAVRSRCPECGEPMWRRYDGTVEQHPNRWNETCQYVGGIAAVAS